MRAYKKQNFMQGALILMLGGVVVKIIGALFKIPLANLIGGEGMSYFTVAYDIYTWMYIITTAGLPVAISRMVSERNSIGRYDESKRIVRIAFITFMLIGAAGAGALIAFSGQLAEIMGNPDAEMSIVAIAPAILFEIVMSAYRGYFQGYKNMTPTAVSQVIVAVVKLTFGYALGYWLLANGYSVQTASAGAIFGVTAGTLLGALYLLIKRLFFRQIRENNIPPAAQESAGTLFKKLMAIIIPITIGSSVLSITNLIDSAIVMRRMLDGAGIAYDYAKLLFGSYSGLARTMFNLPTALIIPLGVSVIPAIAESFFSNRRLEAQRTIRSALRITVLLALPSGVGLAVLSKPILTLLFPEILKEVEIAAPLLTSLAPAVVFVCMVSITNAMLQAVGKEWVPVITMLVGGTVKLVTNYILVGLPGVNISGAPFSTNLCYGLITALNFIWLAKELGRWQELAGALLKPLAASALCGVVAWGAYRLISPAAGNTLAAVAAIGAAACVYFVSLGYMKYYKEEDISLLPKSEKIKKMLAKAGWMR